MTTRAKDAATLKRLELRLQLPSVRTSRAQLEQLLAGEFIEFASSGDVRNKRQTIAALLADPSSALPRYATVQNLKVAWLSEDVAMLTYRSSRAAQSGSRALRANRCSIWKRIDGRWQMLFHQGTSLNRSQ